MKKLVLGCTLMVGLLFANQVTIYNGNFALVRTELELDLQKGFQHYYFNEIPNSIESNSVIIRALKGKFDLFSQNYEYDLANSNKILEKYIGEEIEIISKTDEKFIGKLQFYDASTIGIIENTTNKLILINSSEIRSKNLAKLPDNFFLKPTLHWELETTKAGKYPLDFSYICSNMKWDVTYNAVWNDKELTVNSWVTITNNTGKSFENTKLKLIAGEVQKASSNRYRNEYDSSDMLFAAKGAASFEEKSFHDFHLYTLSENVSINNKQVKQLRLFETTTIKAKAKYVYQTNSNKVESKIVFINSEKAGFGKALPKGIVKIYRQDDVDNNLEFIGEDRINHTPKDEKVKLLTGYAFDLVGETKVLSTRGISKKVSEKDMIVELKNRSEETKTIFVTHKLYGEWQIFDENISYRKIDAHNIEFEKTLKPNESFKITWTERGTN